MIKSIDKFTYRENYINKNINKGIKITAIAKFLGVSRSRIYQIIKQIKKKSLAYNNYKETHKAILDGDFSILIEKTSLNVRAKNALTNLKHCWRTCEVTTISDLIECSQADLLLGKNLGRKTLKHIQNWLLSYHINKARCL